MEGWGNTVSNPGGAYPGRQLFIGTTVDNRAALAYLVTGRSAPSRARKGIVRENNVIIGPIGDQPYDPLRHYTGVKFDNDTGIAVVSNGVQTEAIFETYRLLFHTESPPTKDYLEKLLDGARAEPDSLNTPRIAGVVTGGDNAALVGIKRHDIPARAFELKAEVGILLGVSTYKGDLENPKSFDPDSGLLKLEFGGKTTRELAEHLFDISTTSYQGDDIRVCSVGAIRSGDGHKWELTIHNRHQG